MSSIKIKTPLTYYGGKQNLANRILQLLPAHQLYCEPFVGGGAIFWAKPPSPVEVLNDTNKELINFYEVAKNNFLELERKINITLYSRSMHSDAAAIYGHPHLHTPVDRAWAVWTLCMQSFSAKINGSWGYELAKDSVTKKLHNKKEAFTDKLAIRLQNVQVECADALYIIESRDSINSFFYCDPPYFNSNCGHYDGYSETDFENLLKDLSRIKGKFLLSSYPSEVLSRYAEENGWYFSRIEQNVSVNVKSGYRKKKVEVLTANFKM
jgi:DNA adenine methylase